MARDRNSGGWRTLINVLLVVLFLATVGGKFYMVMNGRELSGVEQVLFTVLELALAFSIAWMLAVSQANQIFAAGMISTGRKALNRSQEIYGTAKRLKQIISRKKDLVGDTRLLESFEIIQSVVDELQAGISRSQEDWADIIGDEAYRIIEVDEMRARKHELEAKAVLLEMEDEIRDRSSLYAELTMLRNSIRGNGHSTATHYQQAPPAQPVAQRRGMVPVPQQEAPAAVAPEPRPAAAPAPQQPAPAAPAAGGYVVHSLPSTQDTSRRAKDPAKEN